MGPNRDQAKPNRDRTEPRQKRDRHAPRPNRTETEPSRTETEPNRDRTATEPKRGRACPTRPRPRPCGGCWMGMDARWMGWWMDVEDWIDGCCNNSGWHIHVRRKDGEVCFRNDTCGIQTHAGNPHRLSRPTPLIARPKCHCLFNAESQRDGAQFRTT